METAEPTKCFAEKIFFQTSRFSVSEAFLMPRVKIIHDFFDHVRVVYSALSIRQNSYLSYEGQAA